MDTAQLFTASGQFVATVEITMDSSGRWPRVVSFRGRHFALENGRYVMAAEVREAAEVVPERA